MDERPLFYMGEFSEFIKNKKNVATLLFMGILILAIPLGLNYRQQQIIKSRASAEPIVFKGDNIVDLPGNRKGFKLDAEGKAIVKLELTSPLGPPAPVSSPSPSPSPSPSI